MTSRIVQSMDRMHSCLEKLLTHVAATITSERGYSALFKGGIVLVGAAMIALSQSGTFLYERDLSAHKLRFAVESVTGKSLESTDCKVLSSAIGSECLLAKHELTALSTSLELFSVVVTTNFWIGLSLLGLSVLGFVLRPFELIPQPKS